MNAPEDGSQAGGGSGGGLQAGGADLWGGGREGQTGPCRCRSPLTSQREPGQGQAPSRGGGSVWSRDWPPALPAGCGLGQGVRTPFLVQTPRRADPLPLPRVRVPQCSPRVFMTPAALLPSGPAAWPDSGPGTHGPPRRSWGWSCVWGRVAGTLAHPRGTSKPKPVLVRGVSAPPSPEGVEGTDVLPSASRAWEGGGDPGSRRLVTHRPALVAR